MSGPEVVLSAPSGASVFAVGLCWGFAAVSVVVGRNLTRSIAAAMASLGALAFLCIGELTRAEASPGVAAGVGLAALLALVVATLVLGLLQLFGWMLVDVDRDHLPPTDRGTWLARSIAFLIVGGGLATLGRALAVSLARGRDVGPVTAPVETVALEIVRDFGVIAGLALSAVLLATLMLLRDDGQER